MRPRSQRKSGSLEEAGRQRRWQFAWMTGQRRSQSPARPACGTLQQPCPVWWAKTTARSVFRAPVLLAFFVLFIFLKSPAGKVFHDPDNIASDNDRFHPQAAVERLLSKRKFTGGTFIWSIKRTITAPSAQPPSPRNLTLHSTSLDPSSQPQPLAGDDEQREMERTDESAEKPHWALQMNSPRSILPDTLREAPAWYNKDTWASAPLPSLTMHYQIHNPVGPRWYRNHHLIPPSQRRPSARPPTIFSPSFPPMSTASLQDRSEDSTRLIAHSRTPSSTPLPTPSSTQPGMPRSRKTSQTAHDDVDLLDASDPWGTSWHHQSPYDVGLISSDKHEILTRPRRLSTTNIQTKRKPAPSPLAQSTSAVDLPNPVSHSIQPPRKLSKRRPPVSGALFGQDRLTTSAPATPIEDHSVVPGPPDVSSSIHHQSHLSSQISLHPPSSSQSSIFKRERRGSVLSRLAKKFSLLRKSPVERDDAAIDGDLQQSNYSRPSGDVNGYGYSYGHCYDAAPPAQSAPTRASVDLPQQTTPIMDDGPSHFYHHHDEADRASAFSIDASYSIGKLKVANPDIPTPEQASPHPVEVPLPPDKPDPSPHERQPSAISAPAQLLSPLSSMGTLPHGLVAEARTFPESSDAVSHRPVSRAHPDSSSRQTPSPDNVKPAAGPFIGVENAPHWPKSHGEDPRDGKHLPRVENARPSTRISLDHKETIPPRSVPSRIDPQGTGKRVSRIDDSKSAHPSERREAASVRPPSRRGDSSPTRSAARGEEVRPAYLSPSNGSSGARDGESSAVIASQTPSWTSPSPAPPPLPSKSPAPRDKRASTTQRSSYLAAPPTTATHRSISGDRNTPPGYGLHAPPMDYSPLSISSLLVNPPTPYTPEDREISVTPEPRPPTVPPKSPRATKHLKRESSSQPSRQTETFRLVRSASGRVYASGETIVAAGEQWEVVESVGNAKTKSRASLRPQDASTSSRKETASQRLEKPKENIPVAQRTYERQDRARSERSRRQASEPGPIATPAITVAPPQSQAKATRRRAPSLEPSSISSRQDRQDDSKHARRQHHEPRKGSSDSRGRQSPPKSQVNTVPFNVNKPQPSPPVAGVAPSPQPRSLERAPSLSNRPTSELPSAELNAVRAKEAWELERLWKAKSMYGGEPDGAHSVPSENSSSAGRGSRHHTDPRHHGSSHTSFVVSGSFQHQQPQRQEQHHQPTPQPRRPTSNIYHSMPLAPPPVVYHASASYAPSQQSSSSAAYPAYSNQHHHRHSHSQSQSHNHNQSHAHAHHTSHRPIIAVATTPTSTTNTMTTSSSRPFSSIRTPLTPNPLPEPPRESTYEFPSRSSKQYTGITLAH
ncbi:hypothetical protein AX16_000458 [Volvariella volvacea WC 439]|nr:hypothetical protein AX16_000458 [Volvariella volvacea WC 439]